MFSVSIKFVAYNSNKLLRALLANYNERNNRRELRATYNFENFADKTIKQRKSCFLFSLGIIYIKKNIS